MAANNGRLNVAEIKSEVPLPEFRPASETQEAVLNYVRSGLAPVPIPCGQKGPTLRGWPDLRIGENDIAAYFPNGENVGLILGAASGGLVDVDLDSPEAVTLASSFLPATERIHGRRSSPASHRWYRTNPAASPEKFSDPSGACLVEIRSTAPTGFETVPLWAEEYLLRPGWPLSSNGLGMKVNATAEDDMNQGQDSGVGQPPVLDGYLTKIQLASQINRSPRTLERWHTARIGPPRIVIGRLILYRTESVREWLAKQERGIRRSRTSRRDAN